MESRIKMFFINNKGSSIVVVLVTMAFVSILGSILLFASLTNFQMKNIERKNKQTFYNAESVLNEVRTGIQQVVSDSIAQAYTDVLIDYNTAVDTEHAFQNRFKDALYTWQKDGNVLFCKSDTGVITYNPNVLITFVSHSDGVVIEGSTVEVTPDLVTFKGVAVMYTENGYQTRVAADICMGLPEFTYTLSNMALTAIPDFSLIAHKELLQDAGTGTLVVDGSAYAGKITVKGTGNRLEVGVADNIVCKGTLTADLAEFYIGGSSALWTKRIEVGTLAKVSLLGDTYVADDIELVGDNSEAVLAGRYFGFGNSITNSAQSSSIIVNGKKTKLDISGLKNLMLAGNSFIGSEKNEVLMGESISVKSNQLAYLVPAQYISTVAANPIIFQNSDPLISDTTALKAFVNKDGLLFDDKTLGSYIDDIQLVFYPLVGTSQTVVYYYMKFNTTDKANKYFADYFKHNSLEIKTYLEIYSDGILADTTTVKNIAGNGISYDDMGVNLMDVSASVSPTTSQRLANMFANLCATLSTTISADGSVYNYIVDEEKINSQLSGETEFEKSGDVQAVISKGNYTINSSTPNTLKVVVATGNVNVEAGSTFTGLVISGGTVNIKANLQADRAGASEAFMAKATIGGKEMRMVDFLKISTEGDDGAISTQYDNNWNLDKLVTYKNWVKN